MLRNIQKVLATSGATMDDVAKVTAHLEHLDRDFAEYNRAYAEFFTAPYPVRTTVGSRLADILVEIDVVAQLPAWAAGMDATAFVARGVYEGAVAHGRSGDALHDAGAFVADLVALHETLLPRYDDPAAAIVTAGGSAFPDVVADVLAEAAARLPGRFVIRSGASLIHDEGYYRSVSPFDGAGLRPAARAIARVVSTPEPGLALLDAGKRDVPYDLDLPVPLARLDADGTRHPLGTSTTDARIDAVNDQHAFLRTDPAVPVALGDRVLLGLSHPCTMFDKGRLLPVVADLDDADPLIVGLIETRF